MKAFFGKICAWIKSTATKVWKWSVAHKAIAITTAAVVVAGTTCAVVLPIALHEHSYAAEWSSDANNHWHDATCKHEEEKSDLAAHTYTNACDTTCDVCGYARTVGAHVYDNACDTKCNVCDAERTITHDHADTLTAGDTTHYYACSVCGDKKDEVAHTFDKTVVSSEYLKEAATATTKAQYYKSCVCGKASATEYFETDKVPANLQVSDISKTYDGTPVAEPTVTFDGVGAENFAYYKGDEKLTERPTDAGTYKVVVTVDETDTHAGDRVEREFTIAKVVVTIPTLEKEYDGCGEFEFVFEGPGGEEIDCLIDIGNANAGTYTDVAITYKSVSSENYEITATTVSAKINKKVLSNMKASIAYDGSTTFGEMTLAHDGIVSGDVIIADIDVTNKNVGVYTGTDAVFAILDVLGHGAANYEIDAQTTEVTVTPKTLNYLEITKVYDGEGVLAYALGTEHGVLAGDTVLFYCDEVPDYIVGTYKLIPYDDPTSIDDPGADDRASLAGADKANYKFAERIEGKYKLCATITVTKRPIWTTGVTFAYGNCTNYTGEESPNSGAIVFQNIVAGETIAYDCVGWTFADVNVGAKLTAVTLYPEDDPVQANYEIDLSKCEAEIVKAEISFTVKVDDKTYDGEAIDFNDVKYTSHPLFVDLSTATIDFKLEDEGEDHYGMNNTPVDAGEYIVRVGISGTENYESYIAYAKFTISPKVINDVKFDFTYNGNDYHQIYLTTENQEGIIGTDQILLEVVFEDGNVGSPVLEAELEKGNYALGTYELSIVPKALTGSIFLDIYYGDIKKDTARPLYYYDYEITEEEYGVVNGDSVTLRALYESPNAGTADTSCDLYEENNYVMGDLNVNNTVISAKTIELPEKQYIAEYTGSSKLILDLSEYAEYGETLEMYFTAMAGTPLLPVSAVGEYTNNVSFSKINYSDTTNYEIILPESYSLKIAPKKLTNLDLKITYNTYDTLSIYLISKDGIVEGEEVKLMPGKNLNAETFKVGDVITLKKFVAGVAREEKEEIVYLAGADKNNYDLADACGTMTCVAYCDVQFDGSCNCGTSHLTETLTFTGGEDVGASATIDCDSTYEGGIYKIALEGGEYEFSGSDQFFNISGIYDANGNKLADSIGTYALTKGTYYFHVYVGTSPSSDTIWVKKTAKILDIENEEIIVTQITDPDDLSYRDEEIADYHSGGDRFVLFYSRNEEDNVLGCSITFYYADENGKFASSAASNIENIEFYDTNGRQLPVTYEEPDMIHEDSVTAIGGVYIVITMNGEGTHLRFGAC